MDRVEKAKLESLIAELRSWPPGERRSDAENLARRYRLDPMIVARVAEAEGIKFDVSTPAPKTSSTSATDFISVEDVENFGREQGKD
jgi:hypothetical protein